MSYPVLQKAAEQAVRRRESAMRRWVAAGRGQADADQLAQFYQQNRQNPRAIYQFAARHVGQDRAAEEAERFSQAMERRLTDGNQ